MNFSDCENFLKILMNGPPGHIENTKTLAIAFNNPHEGYNIIHITGTNGKGTVSKLCASALEKSGYKVGLYISPHISTFRERIRINSKIIPKQKCAQITEEIVKITQERNLSIGWFEYFLFLGFLYFKQENVDWAVIEVGVGGLLDNTNIVNSFISIITSVGFDHVELLGPTLEDIAFQKAGIIKEGRPCVIGPHCPLEVISKVSREKRAELICVPEISETAYNENKRIVSTAFDTLRRYGIEIQENVLDGLDIQQPCRCQIEKINNKAVVLDVGHNPPAISRLYQDLKNIFPGFKFVSIFAMTKGKMHEATLRELINGTDKIYIVSSSHPKIVPYQDLAAVLNNIAQGQLVGSGDCNETVPAVLEELRDNEILVICGSFYIMKTVCDLLGISLKGKL
ncbi:unnamed protein product [Blepharisma stoltei]|uniref:Mur ligase C-terminal domain-containing protein n=1 Tax=Blepharisma stoltei TaxID=1481888 RepID=A0AAU9K628_9CILI|nr:unnamed protein product [Blepharisma stoltei]